jgi:hypothetical protein
VSSISTLTRKKGERGGNGSRSHPTMLLKEGCAIKEHPSEAFVDGADEETFLVEVSVDGVTLRFTPPMPGRAVVREPFPSGRSPWRWRLLLSSTTAISFTA